VCHSSPITTTFFPAAAAGAITLSIRLGGRLEFQSRIFSSSPS